MNSTDAMTLEEVMPETYNSREQALLRFWMQASGLLLFSLKYFGVCALETSAVLEAHMDESSASDDENLL